MNDFYYFQQQLQPQQTFFSEPDLMSIAPISFMDDLSTLSSLAPHSFFSPAPLLLTQPFAQHPLDTSTLFGQTNESMYPDYSVHPTDTSIPHQIIPAAPSFQFYDTSPALKRHSFPVHPTVAAHEDSNTDAETHRIYIPSHSCDWEECRAVFRSVTLLTRHVREVHIGAGKVSYRCRWKGCKRGGRAFVKRHKIHHHIRTHTGEKPFECQEAGCGRRFSRTDSLAAHAKVHVETPPYACGFPLCKKAYYHAQSLRKHQRMSHV